MSEKIIPIKPTKNEQGWIALMRLGESWPKKEIKKQITIGRITAEFEWRSKDSFMGRFGGGWNWHVGAEWSSRTIILFFLIFMVRVSLNRVKP